MLTKSFPLTNPEWGFTFSLSCLTLVSTRLVLQLWINVHLHPPGRLPSTVAAAQHAKSRKQDAGGMSTAWRDPAVMLSWCSGGHNFPLSQVVQRMARGNRTGPSFPGSFLNVVKTPWLLAAKGIFNSPLAQRNTSRSVKITIRPFT